MREDKVDLLTRKSTDIHLLEVLGLQDADSEFAGSGHVAQGDADVSQLLRLRRREEVWH